MKILMMTDYFYPHIGGVEKVVLDLCIQLIKHGHEVCVFTLNIPKNKKNDIYNGIRIIRADGYDTTRITGLQSAISISSWFEAKKIIKDFKPDIIHTHNLFFLTTLIGMLMKKKFHIPTITTLHLGSLDNLSGLKGWLIKKIESKMAQIINKNSDLVISGSEKLMKNGIKIGIDPLKSIIIPNAVELPFFRMEREYSSNPHKIIFIGRLIANKGAQILIESAKKIIKNFPNAKFLFVGDGPMRKKLEAYSKKNHLVGNISFLGTVEDLRPIMKEADVYVRPSLTDGMPYGILEAMATGLPVIATNIAGSPEIIIHGKTGHLIPSNDSGELANAIIHLLSSPTYLVNLAKNGLKLVNSEYDWEKVYPNYENSYRRILEN